MEHDFIETPMLIGKWLYVTALVNGVTSEIILNTEKVIMIAPRASNDGCTITIDCGSNFAEVRLMHIFEEIIGLL